MAADKNENSFPDYFPEDCPPSKADKCNGIVYRAVRTKQNRTLKEKHFNSHLEGITRKRWPIVPECQKCAVSIFTDFKEKDIIISQLESVPANRDLIIKIAKGELSENDGSMLHTPNRTINYYSHHDWWKCNNSDSWKKFSFVE